MKIYIVALAIASLPFRAFAGDAIKDCSDELVSALQKLDRVETYVPQVPPEEASYLEKEFNSAFDSHSVSRLGKVTQRPMYPAWDLHDNFADARFTLKQNIEVTKWAGISIKSILEFGIHLPYALASARVSWENYANSLKEGDMAMDQIGEGTHVMAVLSGTPGFYYVCLANLISDK